MRAAVAAPDAESLMWLLLRPLSDERQETVQRRDT